MAFAVFSNLPKKLLLLFLFIILYSHTTKSQTPDAPYYTNCPTDSNYTANSTFKANLDSLFGSLYSAAAASVSGFSNQTAGQSPNQVYGSTICRSDLSLAQCRTCLSVVMREIEVDCPRGKTAEIWRDYCFLRYSDKNFFGYSDDFFYVFIHSSSKPTDPLLFNATLGNLIGSLTTKAAYTSSLMFAAASMNYTSFSPIYGMVQCTRDLSKDGCFQCLSTHRSEIPQCCGGYEGARLYARPCFIRYEVYPFYNITAVDELSSPPPPPATPPPDSATPPPPPANDDSSPPPAAANGGDEQGIPGSEFRSFNLGTLRGATNGFSQSNKLGEGGFGPVYKGTLQGGQEIAVKRLSWTSSQGLVELRNEVVLLAELQHRNLVRLLGFCLEEEEKLLVYEYLPHRSLDTILFDPFSRTELDLGRRCKIIEGIGRGLLYLHEDSRLKIVHRDLKASNILLDGDMNPKISDFGLARLVDVDETQGNTSRIAGTYGYMAPEYALHGFFSTKSDVFSYGVLVLEILTGRRNNNFEESGQLVDLLSYVWQHWIEGKGLEVIDRSVVAHCQSQVALRCIHIGLLCVQAEPLERPNMTSIILMLSSSSITLQAPKPPAFC
ncbi:cysteine-rich receptor-like protein kinase 6 [Typha angustifolia]|uniref:cysteine-rich receptor-like protein kinase 6 n=1 Tax=Typha angustifolia TaxID=59011 RepID=UPI003C2EB47F